MITLALYTTVFRDRLYSKRSESGESSLGAGDSNSSSNSNNNSDSIINSSNSSSSISSSDSYSSLVGMSSIDCSTLFIEDVIHMAVQMCNHMELTMEDNTFQRGETYLD